MSAITYSHQNTCYIQPLGAVPANYANDERCLCLIPIGEIKKSSSPILLTGCGKIIHFECARKWINGDDGQANLEHQRCMFCRGKYTQVVRLENTERKKVIESDLSDVLRRVLTLFAVVQCHNYWQQLVNFFTG